MYVHNPQKYYKVKILLSTFENSSLISLARGIQLCVKVRAAQAYLTAGRPYPVLTVNLDNSLSTPHAG